jgi:hypothetical protein
MRKLNMSTCAVLVAAGEKTVAVAVFFRHV